MTMRTADLVKQIDDLKKTITHLDERLAQHNAPAAAFKELQHVVDNTRGAVWTVLKATASAEYHEYVAAFRVKRATGLLRFVYENLCRGRPHREESLEALHSALEDLIQTEPLSHEALHAEVLHGA